MPLGDATRAWAAMCCRRWLRPLFPRVSSLS